MKPPAFEYHDPAELGEALELLRELGDVAKVLAGGQSLVPLLNFRLAQPDHLVDVNRIGSLAYVRSRDRTLHVGGLTRQAVLERSPLVRARWPLLTEALAFVAHPQIRNRGTVAGSVAHADPAAELPVALTALDARFHVRSARGARVLESRDMFVTHLTTSLEPDELLVEIEVPPLPSGTRGAFVELSPRHGDFALGGAAVLLELDDGACTRARIALLGAADTPLRASAAEQALVGSPVGESQAADAAGLAVAGLDPPGDIHGGAGYRRDLIAELVRRALLRAAGRQGGG